MNADRSVFWDDLAEDLQDPEFRKEYVLEALRIATIDRLVNDLDAAREEAGLTKSELARVVGIEPSTVRRLFSSHSVNPTLATVTEIATALGLQVVLTPLPAEDSEQIVGALRGTADGDLKGLADSLTAVKEKFATMNDAKTALTR
ncbi:helix-turn-helix domain-containing protein [Streptomyces sp. NPDC007117]|uniref:helix-turn-helix domain-containing protein n=1 Tax=Streptomyces sp. NPDC007117 TaxID=3154314 RepID=UPI0033FE6C7D